MFKASVLLIAFVLSFSANALTTLNATIDQKNNELIVRIKDRSVVPPYDAANLFEAIKGFDHMDHRFVDDNLFNLDCFGSRSHNGELKATCTIRVPLERVEIVNEYHVLKLKGVEARRLNRHFIDSAYISIGGNRVYLSSMNTRSEFYFGVKSIFIK